MGLDAEFPFGIALADLDRQPGILLGGRPGHRLHEKMREIEVLVGMQILLRLRDDDFQFIAPMHDQLRAHFRADANPIDASRNRHRAIGFDGDLEAARVHGVDQGSIELQQGFAAGKDNVLACSIGARPQAVDGLRECGAVGEFSAQFAIGADEIGIAELANCSRAVAFPPRPQIATGKTAKHRRSPCPRALALQGVENFFDAVHHTLTQLRTNGHWRAV